MGRLIGFLCSLALANAVYGTDVYIYERENSGGSRPGTTQKMYVGSSGLVVEQFEPGSSEPVSDIVVLRDGRVIINDRQSRSSSIMDPNNMPDMSGAASAMQEAQAEMQRAMAEMTPEQRAAMQAAMSGLLSQQGGGSGRLSLGGLFGGSSAPPPTPTLRSTGNPGTHSGMDWEEVAFQLLGTNYLYRVADWSEIEGAEMGLMGTDLLSPGSPTLFRRDRAQNRPKN